MRATSYRVVTAGTAILAAWAFLVTPHAQVRKIDAEKLLAERFGFSATDISAEWTGLRDVNAKLWDIEDRIRDKERDGAFDPVFIELARAVYVTNDERALLKKKINTKLGSTLVEEKSYADYTRKG